RCVQDRCAEKAAVDTTIGDGEGATLEFFQAKLAISSLLGEGGDIALNASKALAIRIANHRNHQTFVGANGNTDVVELLQYQLVAIELGVHIRECLQRAHHGLREEAHESEANAMGFLERILSALAQFH